MSAPPPSPHPVQAQAFTAVSIGSFNDSMFGCRQKTRSSFINGTDNITHTHANTQTHGRG